MAGNEWTTLRDEAQTGRAASAASSRRGEFVGLGLGFGREREEREREAFKHKRCFRERGATCSLPEVGGAILERGRRERERGLAQHDVVGWVLAQQDVKPGARLQLSLVRVQLCFYE